MRTEHHRRRDPRTRRSRPSVGVLAVLLAAGLTIPPAMAHEDPAFEHEDPEGELEQTQEELEEATADLERLQQRIDEVEAEVAAADLRLAVLNEDLARVTADLDVARAEAAEAEAAVESGRARMRAADEMFTAAEAAQVAARQALGTRVAATWMYGQADHAELALQGLLAAEGLHDLALLEHASERLLEFDRTVVHEALESADRAASARTEADAAHTIVEALAVDAYESQARAEALFSQQARLVADAEEERGARRAALRRIEDDAAARAALVQRLQERVDELRLASLSQWLRDIADLPFDGPPPPWASALPSRGEALAPAIEAAAASQGLDGRLLAALVWTESAFRPGAVSHAGAIGLTQLMPGTAGDLGVDPYDPIQNLLGGARYLRMQLDRFGRIDLALAAYNAGPGRVVQAGFEVPDIVETQLYVLRVLDRWERLN